MRAALLAVLFVGLVIVVLFLVLHGHARTRYRYRRLPREKFIAMRWAYRCWLTALHLNTWDARDAAKSPCTPSLPVRRGFRVNGKPPGWAELPSPPLSLWWRRRAS